MQQPTPKATTISSGPRRTESLVAVAEIESGSIAIASIIPSETIDSDDRLEPDADAAEPAQHADLDQVVEAEREHGPARGGGADRGEAASLVGALSRREQPVPGARAEDEAREIGERGRGGEQRATCASGQLESSAAARPGSTRRW